jgi:hypothetical protein
MATPLQVRIAVLLLITLCAPLALAQTKSDWKLYAFSNAPNEVALFYLQSDMTREAAGHVRVWTKALDSAKLNQASKTLPEGGEIIKRALAKVAQSYMPPMAVNGKLTAKQSMNVTLLEQIADDSSASPEPVARVLYEIDCARKMAHQMSAIWASGTTDDQVGEWEHIPPESTINALRVMVCQAK